METPQHAGPGRRAGGRTHGDGGRGLPRGVDVTETSRAPQGAQPVGPGHLEMALQDESRGWPCSS